MSYVGFGVSRTTSIRGRLRGRGLIILGSEGAASLDDRSDSESSESESESESSSESSPLIEDEDMDSSETDEDSDSEDGSPGRRME